MDVGSLLKGLILLIISMQVNAQHPTAQQFYGRTLGFGNDYSRRDMDSDFNSFPEVKQKPIKTSGSATVPAAIAFGGTFNNKDIPWMWLRSGQERFYWPISKQQRYNYPTINSGISANKRRAMPLGEQTSRSLNGIEFDDMLYPDADANDAVDDAIENSIQVKDTVGDYFVSHERPQDEWLQNKWPTELEEVARTAAEPNELESDFELNAFLKRNAFHNYKRQKSRPPERVQFLPSISAGSMTHLGNFFHDLKSNVRFMEHPGLGTGEKHLLDGDHPIKMLHEELLRSGDGGASSGTAAFLHAIRNYRPSQKIRSLVSMNPEGYHGSQFLDPNYMWVGLG